MTVVFGFLFFLVFTVCTDKMPQKYSVSHQYSRGKISLTHRQTILVAWQTHRRADGQIITSFISGCIMTPKDVNKPCRSSDKCRIILTRNKENKRMRIK